LSQSGSIPDTPLAEVIILINFGGTATHLADGEYSQLEALFNHRTMPYQLKFEGFFERFGTIGHLSRDMGQATDFVYHRWS